MSRKLIGTSLALAMSLTTSSLFAGFFTKKDSLLSLASKEKKMPPPAPSAIDSPGDEISPSAIPEGYGMSARIDPKGTWDFFATGSFIYWQPREDGLAYSISNPTSSATAPAGGGALSPNIGGHVKNMKSDYHMGYKAGLGMNVQHDEWLIFTEFTHLETHAHASSGAPTNGFVQPLWLSSSKDRFGRDSEARWHLNFNNFDCDLSRPYYVGRSLTFRPSLGLRGGWINQSLNAKYSIFFNNLTTPDVHAHSRSNSWYLGPRASLDTNWILGHGLRIFADVGAALCYTRYKLDYKADSVATVGAANVVVNDIIVRDHVSTARPSAEAGMGFGWGSYFFSNKFHFDISASYDFNIFWDQNMMRYLKDLTQLTNGGEAGNLSFQGLTLNVQFDF